MNGWTDFLLAESGSSAALTGLLFVGVSINLGKIISIPRLPGRALQALLLFFTILIVSSLALVPGQPRAWIGSEVLIVGLIVWCTFIVLDIRFWQRTEKQYRRGVFLLVGMNQLSLLPYIVAGAMILFRGFGGLYWLVPGFLVSFTKGMLDAWVLLIEINR